MNRLLLRLLLLADFALSMPPSPSLERSLSLCVWVAKCRVSCRYLCKLWRVSVFEHYNSFSLQQENHYSGSLVEWVGSSARVLVEMDQETAFHVFNKSRLTPIPEVSIPSLSLFVSFVQCLLGRFSGDCICVRARCHRFYRLFLLRRTAAIIISAPSCDPGTEGEFISFRLRGR